MKTISESESKSCCDTTCCTEEVTASAVKEEVIRKYSAIAEGKEKDCCDGSCCGGSASMSEDYRSIAGYSAEADLDLGCGLPTQFARIRKGDTVIDLGSGAGNDCFIARHETGDQGYIIGIDLTEAMVKKAKANAEKLGYTNVKFILADIEDIPLPSGVADVVVSNCVLNLVPEKRKVFSEIFRVLKPGGHFSISDVVSKGTLPSGLKNDMEMWAGCVSGAMDMKEYLDIISRSGFRNVTIQKERKIAWPAELLNRYSQEELNSPAKGIFSITMYAEKP